VSKAVTTNIRRVEAQLHDVVDQIKASRHDRNLGFARSYVESHPELYEELINDAVHLTVVVNNGYVWVHTHRDDLKNRLHDPNKRTTFVLLHPGSVAASLMEQKENMAPGAYKARTDEALSLIAEAANDQSDVEIYGVSMSLGQAVFLTESKALVVPRFYVEPSVPPVFVFEKIDHKKSYYKRIHDDVDHVLKHKDTVRLSLGTT
jgi:hypothetical protein